MQSTEYSEELQTTVSRFKHPAEMNAEEKRVIDRSSTLLLCSVPTQGSIQEAAFYLANHYWLHESLFAPQLHDYDCYLAQKYAINNALMCILFSIHESHELLASLKEKKGHAHVKALFYRIIERKLTRWTNVYITIRSRRESASCVYTDILHQLCALRLCRMLVREKRYWSRLLEEVQGVFVREGREIEAPEIPAIELRRLTGDFSCANEFLLDLRRQCCETLRAQPGAGLTFLQARSAFQLKWIVGKWSSTPMLTDIVWLYQDVFDEKLWQTFRATTQESYPTLRSAVDAYRTGVLGKERAVMQGARGRYYAVAKRWYLRAFEKKSGEDPLFREYLGMLATSIEGDKTAPSPFTSIKRGRKQKDGPVQFTNAEHMPVEKDRRVVAYRTLEEGECMCVSVRYVVFSTVLSWQSRARSLQMGVYAFSRSRTNAVPDLMEGKTVFQAGVMLCLFLLSVQALTKYKHYTQCTGYVITRHIF
ncbi:hypothetical protein NEAUS03_2246 [Nematocida ausubeli]|nr:hypothetical protein NEAUS03_2246 [Nematocida ausubeli]